MILCDPDKGALIVSLFKQPYFARDLTWVEELSNSIIEAKLFGNIASKEIVINGRSYLPLFTKPIQNYTQELSVALCLPLCSEHGLGISINPHKPTPDWEFRFGDIWSIREFGSTVIDINDDYFETTELCVQFENDKIYQINEIILPLFVRTVLKEKLADTLAHTFYKIAFYKNETIQPKEYGFLFSKKHSREIPREIIEYLTWFFPKNLKLKVVNKNTEIEHLFSYL